VMVVVADLPHGFFVADQNLIVITEAEFFGVASSYQSPNSRKLAKRRGPQVDPLTLKQGDYVVHEIHGIGRFKELVQRDNRSQVREYLVIEYASPKRDMLAAKRRCYRRWGAPIGPEPRAMPERLFER
jgi:transcription-repair coupling factor (superfamily II helicase)